MWERQHTKVLRRKPLVMAYWIDDFFPPAIRTYHVSSQWQAFDPSELTKNLEAEGECDVQKDVGTLVSLYPFQQLAVDQLLKAVTETYTYEIHEPRYMQHVASRFYAQLRMAPGTGKTFVALAFLNELFNRPEIIEGIYTRWSQTGCNMYTISCSCGSCCSSSNRFVDANPSPSVKIPLRKPSKRFAVICSKQTTFQWRDKAKRFFGNAFSSLVACIFTSDDFFCKFVSETQYKFYIFCSDTIRYNWAFLIDEYFDVIVYDGCELFNTSILSKVVPFFVCELKTGDVPSASQQSIGSDMPFDTSTISRFFDKEISMPRIIESTTIKEPIDMANFLNLPPVTLKCYNTVNPTNGWSFLLKLNSLSDDVVKNCLETEISKLKQEHQSLTEKIDQKSWTKDWFPSLCDLTDTCNDINEQIENLNRKILYDDCGVCLDQVAVGVRVHLKCCKSMICLSCLQSVVKTSSVCPFCRGDLIMTRDLLCQSMNITVMEPSDLFEMVYHSLGASKKILVVGSSILDKKMFKIVDSKYIYFADSSAEEIATFRDDPSVRVMFMDWRLRPFGLDFEFVDDLIILNASSESISRDINIFIGSVQRYGRSSPVTVHYFYKD